MGEYRYRVKPVVVVSRSFHVLLFKVDRHSITVTGVSENMFRKGLGIVQRRSSFQHSVSPECYSLPISGRTPSIWN